MSRLTATGHGNTLGTFLKVLEEVESRRGRRICRRCYESRSLLDKTRRSFDRHRIPLVLRQRLDNWPNGSSWNSASTS